jgi:YVTN family beta-propeller protein
MWSTNLITVSVIDTMNNTKIGDDIKVGKGPSAISIDLGKAYVVNHDDNTVSVIDTMNNTKVGDDIKVGKNPVDIDVDIHNHRAYILNGIDNTVSVIDTMNNTKVGDDIKVGKNPVDIKVDRYLSKAYVVNQHDNTVSVIDTMNNTKIGDDIKVGNGPSHIGIDFNTNKSYVVNHDDNTVSVIDTMNNTKVGDDIKVGKNPVALAVDAYKSTVYVTNYADGTVSVIDGIVNKVVAKVIFSIQPANSGHIECDKLIAPIAQQFYAWNGSQCIAKPNQGFEFVSWQENLGGNSTQLIKFSSPPSIWDPILDFLYLKPDKPEAKLDIAKFGNYTANFRALPPPIPPEYVATLFGTIATAFIGTWLTPTIIAWRKSRKQGSRLKHYYNEVSKIYDDGKLDKNDIEKLNSLKNSIAEEYVDGKINKDQYDKLVDEISLSYREIFTKEIDSLNDIYENDKVKQQLSEIKAKIEEAYTKGKINNGYYVNLKKEISTRYDEMFRMRIDSLNSTQENNKAKLLAEIKDDISYAYSKERINELHYTLLKEKVSNYEKNVNQDLD